MLTAGPLFSCLRGRHTAMFCGCLLLDQGCSDTSWPPSQNPGRNSSYPATLTLDILSFAGLTSSPTSGRLRFTPVHPPLPSFLRFNHAWWPVPRPSALCLVTPVTLAPFLPACLPSHSLAQLPLASGQTSSSFYQSFSSPSRLAQGESSQPTVYLTLKCSLAVSS